MPEDPRKIKLGELLVRQGTITPVDLQKALEEHKQTGDRVGSILVRRGLISEDDLIATLSEKYNVPSINLRKLDIDPEVTNYIKLEFAEKYTVMPINRAAGTLIVAVADPANLDLHQAIEFHTQYGIEIVVATESSIKDAIEKYYKNTKNTFDEALARFADDQLETIGEVDPEDVVQLKVASEEAPIVRLVNTILTEAIKKRASDIHLEPYEKNFRVRYRIDGMLQEVTQPALKLKDAIISRLKIMASLDIAERRVPQDGRFKIKLGKTQEMDFRVSVYPTVHGEKVVLRLLDKSNLQLDMTKLGFSQEQLVDFKSGVHQPYGMVLVTGPTGSGKTTTLYSALSEINQPNTNISTIEDPVEFKLLGVNQGQINEKIGLTFATALRSLLRQDPDIIMVGEIRDYETAEIAVKAALTGHLVLSTLHTNDAPSTINRLMNMGVEPFLVSSSVNLIVAQRLARKICEGCKKEAEVSRQALLDIQLTLEEIDNLTVYHGSGCPGCNDTGYKGRIALYEIMVISPEIQEHILSGTHPTELKKAAIRLGMRTMRQSGLAWLKEGVTTVEEVIRSTVVD